MTLFLLLSLAWFLVGFVWAGFIYAHFQRFYGERVGKMFRREDTSLCLMLLVVGPLGVVAGIWFGLEKGNWRFLARSGWLFPGARS